MWLNPQETADLVTFTEETLIENVIFCAVYILYSRYVAALIVNSLHLQLFALAWHAKRFATACAHLLLAILPALSRISGNSVQKFILQIIGQLIEFNYLFLYKGNISGLLFFRSSQTSEQFSRGHLMNAATCLFAYY